MLRVDLNSSQLAVKSSKAIYAELMGLAKKGIDCALKANMQHELVKLLKTFIYDVQNKNIEKTDFLTDINNLAITKHKGRPPKRFKSNVEVSSKRILKDSTNIIDETKGRRCGRCKQFGHYSKTCQNNRED